MENKNLKINIMATPTHDPEWEAKKQKAKELIAAGGCYAIQFWSNTDAIRLCPKEYSDFKQLEAPIYSSEWIASARRAISLIQQGIKLLQAHEQ